MKNRSQLLESMTRRLLTAALTALVCALCLPLSALADGAYKIDATIRSYKNENEYEFQIDVENREKDLNGIVRLELSENRSQPIVYDTPISLPVNTKKQFCVRVPQSCFVPNSSANIILKILNSKEKLLYQENISHIYTSVEMTIPVGILSDTPYELAYFDLGGEQMTYYNDYLTVSTRFLDAATISEELDTLSFLIIDNYDTSVLTPEVISAIEPWVRKGGVLFLGSCNNIFQDAQDSKNPLPAFPESLLDALPVEFCPSGSYSGYDNYDYFDYLHCYVHRVGDGCVMLFAHSLSQRYPYEDNYSYLDYPPRYAADLMDLSSSYTMNRYQSRYTQVPNGIKRFFLQLCNESFTAYFVLCIVSILFYILFVGIILYVILRIRKKMEWYWVSVPISACVMIGLVALIGKGFAAPDSQVISVTMQNTATKEKQAYLHVVDSGYKRWQLKCDDSFRCAGACFSYWETTAEDYYYRILKEGNNLCVSANPQVPFHDNFYLLQGDAEQEAQLDVVISDNIAVTNRTGHDLRFLILQYDDQCITVTEPLLKGETLTLTANDLTSGGYTSPHFGYNVYSKRSKEDRLTTVADIAYALLEDQTSFFVIGISNDMGTPTIDDNTQEKAYTCYYTTQYQMSYIY